MRLSSRVSLITAALALSIVPAASGQSPNSCGRHLGIGWSDGYHSHTACPPKAHAIHQRPMTVPFVTTAPAMRPPTSAAQVPWWKIPAAPTHAAPPETIPGPVEPEAAPNPTVAGQSLLRQPGEGTSVSDISGPRL
jgi:hypothetical protein